jgi:hypothetical protein
VGDELGLGGEVGEDGAVLGGGEEGRGAVQEFAGSSGGVSGEGLPVGESHRGRKRGNMEIRESGN